MKYDPEPIPNDVAVVDAIQKPAPKIDDDSTQGRCSTNNVATCCNCVPNWPRRQSRPTGR